MCQITWHQDDIQDTEHISHWKGICKSIYQLDGQNINNILGGLVRECQYLRAWVLGKLHLESCLLSFNHSAPTKEYLVRLRLSYSWLNSAAPFFKTRKDKVFSLGTLQSSSNSTVWSQQIIQMHPLLWLCFVLTTVLLKADVRTRSHFHCEALISVLQTCEFDNFSF